MNFDEFHICIYRFLVKLHIKIRLFPTSEKIYQKHHPKFHINIYINFYICFYKFPYAGLRIKNAEHYGSAPFICFSV